MKMKVVMVSLLVFVLLMLGGCAGQSGGTGGKSIEVQKASQLSLGEQKEQAYEIFKQILELSDREHRQENLPRIKELYREIINKYPEIGLAQESYLRLIIIAKEEKTASGDAEAEGLYQEFLGKYPDSNLGSVLESEARATN